MSDCKAKCIKFDFRCGSGPDFAPRSLRRSPPDTVFKEPTSKGRDEKGRKKEKERQGEKMRRGR